MNVSNPVESFKGFTGVAVVGVGRFEIGRIGGLLGWDGGEAWRLGGGWARRVGDERRIGGLGGN